MGEDVDLRPAGEIERRPVREKIETGLSQFHASFADQALVEFGLQLMQEAYVRRGIILLRFGQDRAAQSLDCCCLLMS